MNGQENEGEASVRPLKITVVGDGTVGKTCLLYAYSHNTFIEGYVPTIFDSMIKYTNVDGVPYAMTLWDTAGQEEYHKLRILSYPRTDCFLLCFAVDNPASFTNIELKWKPELRQHCPNAAIVLVGTKSDLRNESPNICIPSSKCLKLKKKIGANAFVECSALTQDNLNQAFEAAIRSAQYKSSRSRRCCRVL